MYNNYQNNNYGDFDMYGHCPLEEDAFFEALREYINKFVDTHYSSSTPATKIIRQNSDTFIGIALADENITYVSLQINKDKIYSNVYFSVDPTAASSGRTPSPHNFRDLKHLFEYIKLDKAMWNTHFSQNALSDLEEDVAWLIYTYNLFDVAQ